MLRGAQPTYPGVNQFATGYAAPLIQLYATEALGFNQADNGLLMSEFSFVRSTFLIFIFPRLIRWGRKAISFGHTGSIPNVEVSVDDSCSILSVPISTTMDASESSNGENSGLTMCGEEIDGSHFDLVFLRYSLVVDAIFTTLAAFASRPWHIYLGICLKSRPLPKARTVSNPP
jgi:hypothetical protein